jgi:RNA polymerase sigma factor (sigma-70 family)
MQEPDVGTADAELVVDVPAPAIGFDAFYEREYHPLLRLAIGLVDQRDRAEELVHDAFERTLLRWSRLDKPGAFARTAVLNGARSELRRRAVARRWRAPSSVVHEMPEPDDRLRDALASLSPKRRIAIVLRYFEDRSEAETAALMNCRVGTVKSLVSRGLTDLRKVVEP